MSQSRTYRCTRGAGSLAGGLGSRLAGTEYRWNSSVGRELSLVIDLHGSGDSRWRRCISKYLSSGSVRAVLVSTYMEITMHTL